MVLIYLLLIYGLIQYMIYVYYMEALFQPFPPASRVAHQQETSRFKAR